MSLPIYLSNIKSSGIYRFMFDKSQIATQYQSTLRLVVGYSEKGPFNTPVYIGSQTEFINTFGNISKRMERKGIFFHRMALQALSEAPILALNIKPFDEEEVDYVTFSGTKELSNTPIKSENDGTNTYMTPDAEHSLSVKKLYDTSKMWSLDTDLSEIKCVVEGTDNGQANNFIKLVATDSDKSSCTVLLTKNNPPAYDMSASEWYNNVGLDQPEYVADDLNISDTFMGVYVFKGRLSGDMIEKYLEKSETDKDIGSYYTTDAYGHFITDYNESCDMLAEDENSGFIAKYVGSIIPDFKDANGEYISLDILFNADYSSHKMLMKIDDNQLYDILDLSAASTKSSLTVTDNNNDDNISLLYIKGYDYKSITKTHKDETLQNIIFDELKANTGLIKSLTNNVDIEYHYLVDTFQTYPSISKSIFSQICKDKSNAFAILNYPAIKNMPLIYNYSLPSASEGGSFCGFYTQLIFSDGTVRSTVPSAALVSNLFVEKFKVRYPYSIIAGPNYGQLSYSGLIGPDYNFDKDDRDILEPKGVNVIVYVPKRGIYINSETTTKVKPISSLTSIHVRELVIFLQDEIADMLRGYQWEFNNSSTRTAIKEKADSICELIKNNGGLYKYTNICNSTNNTDEVINNRMVILDISIEPSLSAAKMIQRLYLYSSGELKVE